MAPRREILDSEDDGSDFGDGPLFGDEEEMPGRHMDAAHETIINASHSAGTDSTDPSFFQRIYDQQAAANADDAIPDTAPAAPAASTWTDVSSAPPPGQKPRAKDPSSLTSITDPTPASRKAKKTREMAQTDVIDLTDLTTPRKEPASGSPDVWDVPTSTRSQRSTRTYGKRKMAQLSLEQEAPPDTMSDTRDPYAFPASSPPARKKNKRGNPSSSAQQPPDSSPVMLIHVPAEEPPPSADRQTRSSRKKKASSGAGTAESSMPDTAPPSLYVAQSTLTASQKREYAAVSLSSQDVPGVAETFLPGQSSIGGAEVYKSSGATTIAYPTPSRIGSSRRLPEASGEVEGSDVAGTSLGYDVGYQQSSPDVLTDMSTGTTASAKRSQRKIASSSGLGSSELEPPTSTRGAKRRKVVQEVEDNPSELDALERTREGTYIPQQSEHGEAHTGGEGLQAAQSEEEVQAPAPDTEPSHVDATNVPTETPKPAAKGKRGRKKKGAKSQDVLETPEEAVDRITNLLGDIQNHFSAVSNEPAPAEPDPQPAPQLAEEVPEPPSKRKRGRPRKSETAKPQTEPMQQEPPKQQPVGQVQPPAEADATAQPLSELSRNSQPDDPTEGAGKGDEGANTANKENNSPVKAVEVSEAPKGKEKQKEEGKQAVKDVKPGVQKMQYRVGLSKRSRIAPLLKSLKKPV